MPRHPEKPSASHGEIITAARHAVLAELLPDDTAIGRDFLAEPAGPRARLHGAPRD